MRTTRTSIAIAATLVVTSCTKPSDEAHREKRESRPLVQPPEAKPAPPAEVISAPIVDAGAIAALVTMGAFLRAQKTYAVHTTSETDHLLPSGQRITLSAKGDFLIRKPDHLRADIVSDRKDRQFIYDGKTFTINGRRLGFYATVPAPATILELVDALEDNYGLTVPLVDLVRWGTNEGDLDEITSAIVVGPTQIEGVDTYQYAFQQPGLDWQVWIQRGDQPLPRKLVLTTTDDPARPVYAVKLTWDLAAKPGDTEFTFVPTKDAHPIVLAPLSTDADDDSTATPNPQ